eukprot:scaffold13249_cov118-Isochrysis_galbana.AAC.8
MSISAYASDRSAASQPLSQAFIQSTPSHQPGMVQPVVQEMFATVHAAGSSLLGGHHESPPAPQASKSIGHRAEQIAAVITFLFERKFGACSLFFVSPLTAQSHNNRQQRTARFARNLLLSKYVHCSPRSSGVRLGPHRRDERHKAPGATRGAPSPSPWP